MSVSGRRITGGSTRRNLLELMSSGEWYTRHEVTEALHISAVGRPPGQLSLDMLVDAVITGDLCAVTLPGNETTPLYHLAPHDEPDAELDRMNFFLGPDLPCALRRTVVAKADELHRRGILPAPVPGVMRVMNLVDDNLNHLRLLEAKPRPELGFQYQCRWQAADYKPTTSPAPKRQLVWIRFMGRIKSQQPLSKRAEECVNSGHRYAFGFKTAWANVVLRQDRENASIAVSGVGCYTADSRSLKLLGAPPRRVIVQMTKQVLAEAAQQSDETIPFTPIKSRFRLLTRQAN